jgi:hypothetical protein
LGGRYSGSKLLDLPGKVDFKNSARAMGARGAGVKHSGEQEHVELVSSINLRCVTFPWNRHLDTSLAFGGGLSLATEVPVLERPDPDNSDAAALLH